MEADGRMHFQFLIEDLSGEVLVREIMEKLKQQYPEISYDSKAFKGLGGLKKKSTPKETKTGKLLNDLGIYLRGFNKKFQNYDASSIVVVMDNDDRIPEVFRKQLEALSNENKITVDHIFCIAVEELEAWLLGDEEAVLKAYPHAKTDKLHAYEQDSICGTWEVLADVIYPGGYSKMVKDCSGYPEIGKRKSEWAQQIGSNMNIRSNKSPSFQYFIREVSRRLTGH